MLRKVLLVALPVFCLGLVVFFVNARPIGVNQVECGKWELMRDFPFEPSSLGGYANAIAAVSKDDVWVVGEIQIRNQGEFFSMEGSASQPMILHWDGKTLETKSPSLADLGFSSNDSLAVLADIDAVSPDDVWAVGYYTEYKTEYRPLRKTQLFIIHWDGKAWTKTPSPPIQFDIDPVYLGWGAGLVAIAAAARNDVWIAGAYIAGASREKTLIMHWDGKQWEIVPSPNMEVGDNWLNSLEVISANDVWAAGGSSEGGCEHELLLHWDGKQWSIANVSGAAACDHSIAGLSAIRPDDVWTVGRSRLSKTLIGHWDGKSWSAVSSPDPSPQHGNYLTDVAMASPNDGWAVGDQFQPFDMGDWNDIVQKSMVLHWDGKNWLEVAAPTPYGSQRLRDVAIVAPNEVWVAGGYAPSDILEWIPNPLVARYVACPRTSIREIDHSSSPTIAP